MLFDPLSFLTAMDLYGNWIGVSPYELPLAFSISNETTAFFDFSPGISISLKDGEDAVEVLLLSLYVSLLPER